MDVQKQIRGDVVKTWIIVGLAILIVVLIFSNMLSVDTKRNFYWLLGFLAVLVLVWWFMQRKKKMDIYQIAKYIVHLEHTQTGNVVDSKQVNVDVLDAETFVFSFKSAGKIVSYKWDRVNDSLIARLTKTIDEIKNEANQHELMRQLSMEKTERSAQRRTAEKEGFEILEDGEAKK